MGLFVTRNCGKIGAGLFPPFALCDVCAKLFDPMTLQVLPELSPLMLVEFGVVNEVGVAHGCCCWFHACHHNGFHSCETSVQHLLFMHKICYWLSTDFACKSGLFTKKESRKPVKPLFRQ